MAILRPMTKMRAERETHVIKRYEPKVVKLSNEEITRRDAMIAAYTNVEHLPKTGKPLRCQKWYQADYRSATPKGMVLKSAKVRGQCERWGVK